MHSHTPSCSDMGGPPPRQRTRQEHSTTSRFVPGGSWVPFYDYHPRCRSSFSDIVQQNIWDAYQNWKQEWIFLINGRNFSNSFLFLMREKNAHTVTQAPHQHSFEKTSGKTSLHKTSKKALIRNLFRELFTGLRKSISRVIPKNSYGEVILT